MSGRNTARATVGGEFPSYTLSVVQRVPNSPVVHVSASPPLIPDSRISRVRLAAIACPHRTFPHLPRLKRSLAYPPRGCSYTFGSAPSVVATVSLALCPDGVSTVAPAMYREPLCPRWVLPTAGWFQHHLRGHYPSFLAPTGSCAPPPFSRSFRLPYTARLCRLRRAPAGSWWFPTLSLRVCPSMRGPLPRRCGGCMYPVLPHHHRPSSSPYEPLVLVACEPTNPIVLISLIVMAIHFLQAGRKRATLPGAEESMTTTIEFITALFYEVDEQMGAITKHPEAHLWPSEVVTLGLLHALQGVGNRPF